MEAHQVHVSPLPWPAMLSFGRLKQSQNGIGSHVANALIASKLLGQSPAAATDIDDKITALSPSERSR